MDGQNKTLKINKVTFINGNMVDLSYGKTYFNNRFLIGDLVVLELYSTSFSSTSHYGYSAWDPEILFI